MSKRYQIELVRQIEIAALVMENPDEYSDFDLADEFSVSATTIRRDVRKLREMGVIIHSRKRYYQVYGLDLKVLNKLITTYLALNNNQIIKNLKLIEKRFKDKTLSLFIKITKAINENRIIELDYGYDYYGELKKRLITPITLSQTGKSFNLLALENDNIKFFKLEKIVDINFTKERAQIKNLPNTYMLFKNVWGIYTGGEEHFVSLKFNKKYEDYIRDNFFIENQEINNQNGDLILSMNVKISNEFISWIMGWGGNVEILEPEELKIKVIDKAKDILKNYQ